MMPKGPDYIGRIGSSGIQEIIGLTPVAGNTLALASTPTITSGTQIFDFNYTPTRIGSKIIFTSHLHFARVSGGSDAVGYALFIDNATNAVAVSTKRAVTLDISENIHMRHEFNTESLDQINFKCRIGTNGGFNIELNSESGSDYGGLLKSWATVEEFLV